MTKPKILLWDIETTPRRVAVWGNYEQNVLWVEKEWELLSVAWQWLGQSEIHCVSRRTQTEETITNTLWYLLDTADFSVAHNGDDFDIKKARTKMEEFHLPPFEPGKTIDTLKLAKKYFAFPSNKLDDICEYLKIGKKQSTGGFSLWKACSEGDVKALKKMERYNTHDVKLLGGLYKRLRPWIRNQPALEVPNASLICPNPACMSPHSRKQGFKHFAGYKKQNYQCTACGRWFVGKESR